MCLHQVTSLSFLKDTDFSNVRPTFEAATAIMMGLGGC